MQTVSLPTAAHVLPFFNASEQTFLAAAGATINSVELSIIYELSLVDQSTNDFYSR